MFKTSPDMVNAQHINNVDHDNRGQKLKDIIQKIHDSKT